MNAGIAQFIYFAQIPPGITQSIHQAGHRAVDTGCPAGWVFVTISAVSLIVAGTRLTR